MAGTGEEGAGLVRATGGFSATGAGADGGARLEERAAGEDGGGEAAGTGVTDGDATGLGAAIGDVSFAGISGALTGWTGGDDGGLKDAGAGGTGATDVAGVDAGALATGCSAGGSVGLRGSGGGDSSLMRYQTDYFPAKRNQKDSLAV